MVRPVPPITVPIPRGIDRFAGPDLASALGKLSDGLDVINDDGTLRTRPGYVSVGTGPAFGLPVGDGYVITETLSAAQTNRADRTFTCVAATNLSVIYFGYTEVFDGIWWRNITTALAQTNMAYAVVEYWTSSGGGSWEPTTIRDTTVHREGAEAYLTTLGRDGIMAWRRSTFDNWAQTAVNGITRYWVKITLTTFAATPGGPHVATSFQGDITVAAPGPQAFHLMPVTGLMPGRLRNGLNRTLVCGDRRALRGQETGAQIGLMGNDHDMTRLLRIVEDYGAGVVDQVTNVGPNGAGTWTVGVAGDKLTKLLAGDVSPVPTDGSPRSYDWFFWPTLAASPPVGQFTGSAIKTGLAATGTATVPILTGLSALANEYEHCWLRCTTAGGIAAGEFRQIQPHAAGDSLTVYPPFSASPSGLARFAICRPPFNLLIDTDDVVRDIDKHDGTVGDDTLDIADTTFAAGAPTAAFVFFYLGMEPRWILPHAMRWSFCFDPVTNTLILTNGACMLAYDGQRLSRLRADASSTEAILLSGAIPDRLNPRSATILLALSKLRTQPPIGKYVVDFAGSIIVIGTNDGYGVSASAPGTGGSIWFLANETRIRDGDNLIPTGGASLNDRLYVWTPTMIHESAPPDDKGGLNFRPVSHGIGFIAHHAVVKVALNGQQMLLGVNSDGLYAFSGIEPTPVIDRWDRIFDQGLNLGALAGACGAVMQTLGLAFYALPPKGSATNTRMLVYDFVNKAAWVWSLTYGCTTLAVEKDDGGNERLLIGCDDGFVTTMTSAPYDDNGTTIASYAVFSPMELYGERMFSFMRCLLKFEDMGSAYTVSVGLFMDRREVVDQSATSQAVDAGQGVIGGVLNTVVVGDKREKEVRTNAPSGSIGNQVQVKITGSGPFRLTSAAFFARPLGQHGR